MTTLLSHLHSLSIVTCSTGLSHRFATYRLSFPLQTRVCQTHAWGWCFYSTTWRVRVSLTGTLSCQGSMTLPLIPCTLRYNFERTGRTQSVHRCSGKSRLEEAGNKKTNQTDSNSARLLCGVFRLWRELAFARPHKQHKTSAFAIMCKALIQVV